MKVALLQDLFDHEIVGGAEKNDSVLLSYLNNNHNVEPVHTYKIKDRIDDYDFFIVSNFIMLPDEAKQYLINKKNYIIYEHDHKYVSNRNPGVFPNFNIPTRNIINKEFYVNAKKVFVLSEVCKKVIEQNLQIDNVISIGCSLWSNKCLEIIKSARENSTKHHEYGILNSGNSIKGTAPAMNFCKSKDINPALIGSPVYGDFIGQLAMCENFIFFPQVLETFSRVCVEAKMVNCNVLTTPKLVGFFSEDYSSLKGEELQIKITSQINNALKTFEEVIF